MSDCCGGPPAERPSNGKCWACGQKGRPVDTLTVKALLTETALARLAGTEYRFCAEAHCPVVYFGANGQILATDDVRVPVWQKHPFGDRMVCYCFGEDEAHIREELADRGACLAVQRVREHIAAGRCACEVRNPKGTCCLGDVAAAVKRMMAALQPAR